VISSIHPYRTVSLGEILKAQYTSDRLSLPLEHNTFVRLKYVTGVPGSDGEGFSVAKLKLLDTLIERLRNLKGKSIELPTEKFSDESLDRLIGELTEDLHAQIKRVAPTPFGLVLGAGSDSSGVFLDLIS